MQRSILVRFFLGMALLSLTVALSACSGDKQGESSSSLITVGIPQDLESGLDPHQAVAAGTQEVLFNIFEGLVKPMPDGDHTMAIASKYTIAEDGLTYTFTLREGVKFHDGSLVTVDDIKYSLSRCAGLDTGIPLVVGFDNLEAVTVIDEATVELALRAPDTEFIAVLTAAIIPASNPSPETNPIGTGPYAYESRSPHENFIIARFDDYWGEKAHIEKVVFKIVANADTIVMELEGGGIDMFPRVTASQAAQLSDRFTIYEGAMNLVQALFLNHDAAPFDSLEVRRAMCYATDPAEIMLMVSDGKGFQLGSNIFPSYAKYFMPELNGLYPYDPEKARELLAEAGYADGFSFTVKVPSNYQQHIDTAQVIAEQLRAVGITANIELIEWESWLGSVYSDREFEATIIGLTASGSLTARSLLDRYVTGDGRNFINYSNPAYDEAFAGAVASADDDIKTSFYKECQRILAEDAANVYIQDLPEFIALDKRFAGYEFYPLYVQDMAKVYIAEERP